MIIRSWWNSCFSLNSSHYHRTKVDFGKRGRIRCLGTKLGAGTRHATCLHVVLQLGTVLFDERRHPAGHGPGQPPGAVSTIPSLEGALEVVWLCRPDYGG